MEDGDFVERECLLLEAGEYADKGLVITEDDLAEIAANSEGEIPVRIEHLAESPFDGALGVVTRIRAVGRQLWGTLRQPVEARRLAQKAGARSLSVALDAAGKRILETSFVTRPRVARAQVFSGATVIFEAEISKEGRDVGKGGPPPLGSLDQRRIRELFRLPQRAGGQAHQRNTEDKQMSSVRQFAEGVIQYIRGAAGGSESGDSGDSARFAREREALETEREAIRRQRVENEVAELKRLGMLKATESAEGMARTILNEGFRGIVTFGGAQSTLAALFSRFLKENGPVVPMGEMARADSGSTAADRLIALAREEARKEGVSYATAFARVTNANPDMARAAREEAMRG